MCSIIGNLLNFLRHKDAASWNMTFGSGVRVFHVRFGSNARREAELFRLCVIFLHLQRTDAMKAVIHPRQFPLEFVR